MDRSSIPPTIPYSQTAPPRPAAASHHCQYLSQPAFFSMDSLPPLSPFPYRRTSPTSSISDSADMSAAPLKVTASDGLPPRKIHRRSRSDLLLSVKPEPSYDGAEDSVERKPDGNVGDNLFDAFLNLDSFGVVESSGYFGEELDSRGSGNRKNGSHSSESEAESCAIDCAMVGESSPAAKPSRHFRSISMDGFVGRINFCEGSLRVPPSPRLEKSQNSECDSMGGTFSLEFGSGEFSGAELKKIVADKRLEEIALADPKRVKRILANRQSAARSKERKVRYITELECKVQTLQTEATTLSAQLTLLQRDSAGLATQNNELKTRLHAMEQQAQLRDALNEALSAEVQRLRLATAGLDDHSPDR